MREHAEGGHGGIQLIKAGEQTPTLWVESTRADLRPSAPQPKVEVAHPNHFVVMIQGQWWPEFHHLDVSVAPGVLEGGDKTQTLEELQFAADVTYVGHPSVKVSHLVTGVDMDGNKTDRVPSHAHANSSCALVSNDAEHSHGDP